MDCKIGHLVLSLTAGFAYTTLYERKVLARMQVRIGPNRAGPLGILQPVADGIKLIFKEDLIPANADKFIFVLAPSSPSCRPWWSRRWCRGAAVLTCLARSSLCS